MKGFGPGVAEVVLRPAREFKPASLPNGYEVKRAHLERSPDDVRIIVTGSSHAFSGVKPRPTTI